MNRKVIEKYFPIVKKYFPNCKKEKIELLDDGYDHFVLLVDNLHAFRFPRTEIHGKKDHVENKFLKRFAINSPVCIPLMSGQIDQNTGIKYQIYEFIQGIKLSKELVLTLTEQELITLAIDMGRFLTQLHSFSLSEARAMDMDELDPVTYGDYFKDFLEKDREAIFSLLSIDEQEWIEELIKYFSDLTKNYPFKVKVTHSNLLPEHIIIDADIHKLNGIIDFSLRIADPAKDFTFFDRYGDVFLQTVYKNYNLSVDKYFDKRRKFYAANLPVVNLYQSLERNDEKMIKAHFTELKEYIKTHKKIG